MTRCVPAERAFFKGLCLIPGSVPQKTRTVPVHRVTEEIMLTAENMNHLARLARLAPEESVLERFSAQCDDILSYMDVLAEVDTTSVEPLYTPVEHGTPYREDIPVQKGLHAEVLSNAPEADQNFFIVPRIV